MASGRLGAADLAASTYTSVYQVPASTVSSVNIAITNRGNADATVRVAITLEASTPLDSEFVEYGAIIPANGGILERTALVAGAGEKVMVWSSHASVSVRVHGFEESV